MTFSLKLTKLRARLYFPSYSFPYWLGNKFRGGFGAVLVRAICGYIKPRCNVCNSSKDCLYYVIYEKDRQKRGKSQPPRPIVFIPPFFGKEVSGRGEIEVEVNVFGNFYKFLPHLIYGLRFFGKIGINSNSKYELLSIRDVFSGKEIYDGERVYAERLKTIEISEVEAKKLDEFSVKFFTPIEAKAPITLEDLLRMIRRRLILYVNEYGTGSVPEFNCSAEILESEWENHRLVNYSRRKGKRVFNGVTGYVRYRIKECDENSLKLLSIGELIGAGSKASFGMGFLKISI
ncbi:MAG: CRISPR system precrRNA processing endoribonuclease RAMP protein Cas6 [Archaeoglobaceae archaeon]